jgi:hypothetical protein
MSGVQGPEGRSARGRSEDDEKDQEAVGDDLRGIERHASASILRPVEMNAIQAGR